MKKHYRLQEGEFGDVPLSVCTTPCHYAWLTLVKKHYRLQKGEFGSVSVHELAGDDYTVNLLKVLTLLQNGKH